MRKENKKTIGPLRKHFLKKRYLRFNSSLEDAVDELVAWTVAVAVLVQLAEEVLDAGLLVVVELEVALSPLLPVEVLHLLQLLRE
jgi:hypothetical protein